MHLNIRLATQHDAQALAEVRHNAIGSIDVDAGFYSAAELDDWVGDTSARIDKLAICKPHIVRIVAEIEHEIIGFGEMCKTTGLVSNCFVKVSAKGSGVGRKIIAVLEQKARENGLGFMQLEASKNAKDFYFACGFRSAGNAEISIPNPRLNMCLMMRKDLI